MIRQSVWWLGLAVLLAMVGAPAVSAYEVALGVITVFDGNTQVVAEKVEVTKEGGETQVIKPLEATYFVGLETRSHYTLNVRLKDKRHMSVSGVVGEKSNAIGIRVTFGPFAHRTNIEKVGDSLFCVGKLQLVDRKTDRSIKEKVLLSCKRTDAEGSFNTWTNDAGSASIVFAKPSNWEITIAPFQKTVKSELLKVEIDKKDVEKSLRLPVTDIKPTGSTASSGGM